MINIHYPYKLIEILDKSSKATYIPKKITNPNKMLIKRKYYSEDFIDTSYFKVTNTFNVDNQDYVEISFSDSTYWVILAQIESYNVYELMFDNIGIMKEENIINSRKSYYGYEIKYWFYRNYRYKMREFKPFIEDSGKLCIDDNVKYFISAEFKDNKYMNCKLKSLR